MRTIALGIVLAFAVALHVAADEKEIVLLRPPLWVDPDNKTIPEPPERDASEIYDLMYNTWLRQLDFGYKGVQGAHRPALNVNYFRAEDLDLDEDATYEDMLGRKRPMTRNDLDVALERVASRANGSYRGLASHYIRGVPKGYFPYWGVRQDDPNDVIPHELRRELRGFRVIASWFNHVDTKEVNTFDAFVKADGREFLRHYFIDFGSTMGSGNFKNGPIAWGTSTCSTLRRCGNRFIRLAPGSAHGTVSVT